jgi:hypothetical protein
VDTRGTAAASGLFGRLRQVAIIVIFDAVGPLVVYGQLRSHGLTAVTALLLSGILPAAHVTVSAIVKRRADLIGVVVLAGIAVGTVFGLVSHNARLVLVEGSVPTGVFGVACLVSVWVRRPLMFRLAFELTGPDTEKGRQLTLLWQYEEFRRIFRIITAVWGTGFLIEAALRVVIVYNASTGTALASSNASPFVFGGILSAWTLGYVAYLKKKGERSGFVMPAVAGAVPSASVASASVASASPRDLVPLADGQPGDEGGGQLG